MDKFWNHFIFVFFLYSVGYNLVMSLDILDTAPFFIYHTITNLTLLSLDEFFVYYSRLSFIMYEYNVSFK